METSEQMKTTLVVKKQESALRQALIALHLDKAYAKIYAVGEKG